MDSWGWEDYTPDYQDEVLVSLTKIMREL